MNKRLLKVKSVDGHMVQDVVAMRSGLKRFLGYARFEREVDGQVRIGFERTDDVVTVQECHHYFDALRSGALDPADEATAAIVGRPPPTKSAPAKAVSVSATADTPTAAKG
jgi:hypothetical protein